MKKIIITIASVLLLVILTAAPVLADSPTDVNVTWSGAGGVDGDVTAGDDASASFHSEGSSHTGAFHATDSNNNPYGYGVDSCSFSLDTAIAGTGWAELDVNRTDAKTSYGAAGQQSYTFVGVSSGAATLQNRSGTNYASMKDCNYGWNANDHITVTGASMYTLQRFMDSGNNNFAGILAGGSGDADLDCMNAEASAGQVRLGPGCGCYTNADFSANGAGTIQLDGVGNNSATTAMAPGMVGASSFTFVANWIGGFSIADYSITAN